jgi:ribosome-associated translation inhibitor RaiA
MKIEIQFDGMTTSEDLQERIERRIAFVLGIHSDRINALRVHLTRVNEPRDGIDKSCQVQALLAGGQKVLVEIMDSDLHVAIHRAVDRAGGMVARRLQRERLQANRKFVTQRISYGHTEPVWPPESTSYSAHRNRH